MNKFDKTLQNKSQNSKESITSANATGEEGAEKERRWSILLNHSLHRLKIFLAGCYLKQPWLTEAAKVR